MMEKRAFGLSWFSGPGGGFFKPRAFVKAFLGERSRSSKKGLYQSWQSFLFCLKIGSEYLQFIIQICFPLMMKRFAKQFEDWYSSGCIEIHTNICIFTMPNRFTFVSHPFVFFLLFSHDWHYRPVISIHKHLLL